MILLGTIEISALTMVISLGLVSTSGVEPVASCEGLCMPTFFIRISCSL
jgi:hypothetical protein